MNLSNVNLAELRALIGSACHSKVTLAADTTPGQEAGVTTTGTTSYSIDGVWKTKAAIDNGQYSAGHDKVLDGYSCLFAFALNAAGTLTTFQGLVFKVEGSKFRGYRTYTDNTGAVTGYSKELALVDKNCAFLPDIPTGNAVIGVSKIVLSGRSGFTAGTTTHIATGVTATFSDVMALPADTIL